MFGSTSNLEVLIEARDRASQKVGSFANNIKQHSRAVGLAMAGMGTAILAAGALSVKTYAQMGDEVDKMSKRTGWSTESLSELSHVANISGTSLTQLNSTLNRLSRAIVDGEAGMTTYTRAFDRLGLSTSQLLAMSPEEQFWTVIEALGRMTNETEQAATAQELFGRQGTALLPIMDQGAEGIEDLRREAHELGLVFDEEAAAGAADFKDDLTRLEGSMNGLKMMIGGMLADAFQPLINMLTTVITGFRNWAKEHPELARVITIVATALGALLLIFGTLTLILPGLTAAMGAFGISLHTALGPIGLVALAIAGLVAAGLAMKAHWDKIKHFFQVLWDHIQAIFAKAIRTIIEYAIQPFLNALASVIDFGSKIVGFFKKDWGESMHQAAESVRGATDGVVQWTYRLEENANAHRANMGVMNDAAVSTNGLAQAQYNVAGAYKASTQSVRDYAASLQAAGATRQQAEQQAMQETGASGIYHYQDFPGQVYQAPVIGEVLWMLNRYEAQLSSLRRQGYEIPSYQFGGIVAGSPGRPTAAIVHGGETVLPTGGLSIPIYLDGRQIAGYVVDLATRRVQLQGV